MTHIFSKIIATLAILICFSATQSNAQTPTVDFYYVDVNNTNRRLPNNTITFMRGVEPHRFALRADVNWRGAQPGSAWIEFNAGGRRTLVRTGNVNQSSMLFTGELRDDQINWLNGAQFGANGFEFYARTNGLHAVASIRNVNAILVPGFVQNFLLNGNRTAGRFDFEFEFPPGGIDLSRALPLIGEYGPKLGLSGRIRIETDWGRITGSATGGVKWKSGGRENSISVTGSLRGTLTRELDAQFNPHLVWRFDELSVSLSFKKKFTVAKLTILDKFAPGAATQIAQVPLVGPAVINFLKTLSVSVTATPGITGGAKIDISPNRDTNFPEFKSADVKGEVDIRLTVNASLDLAPLGRYGLEGYVGGRPSINIDAFPQLRFNEFRFQAYFGATLFLGPIRNNFEHTFLNVTTAPAARMLLGDESPFEMNDWSIIDRSYLDNYAISYERSLLNDESQSFIFAGNVTPLSYPAMANRGDELMVVYAMDNGNPGLQFTDLYYKRYVDAAWTYPEILPNPNGAAQIFPSVAFDGQGRPVAVWQQMDDPSFEDVEPLAYLSHNDIAASIFDPETNEWSEPVIFGHASHADLAPTIVGPMADGDLLAFWTSSQLDHAPLGAPAGELRQRVWDADTSTWGPTTTIMPIESQFVTYKVDAKANTGVLVYGWDDVINDDFSDTSIRYRTYNHATQSWSAEQILSSEIAPTGDLSPTVLVTADNSVYVSWVRDNQFVIDRNLIGDPVVVREDAETLAGIQIFLHESKDGVVIASWSDMTEQDDAAIVSAFYDPIAEKWSKDVVIGGGEDMETLMGITTDSHGNYVPIYMETDLIYTTKQATDDDGNMITYLNVPQPGQRYIVVDRLPIGPDMDIDQSTFVCDSQRLFKGDEVTLTATIRNKGELTVPDAIVTFYDGNPLNVGREIGKVSVGELLGGESKEVQFSWTLEELYGEANIYAVADADGLVDETDETDNFAAIHIGGVNLTCGDVDYEANGDGSATLLIPVYNDGAATNKLFYVRVTDPETQVTLIDTSIDGLGAGEYINLALDLPVGTIPEPGKYLHINIDYEDDVVELTDDDNIFELWISNYIDEDGDGMSRLYEDNHGFSDTDPLDAGYDSDGDGQINLSENMAGTDPHDSNSRLLAIIQPSSVDGNLFTISWDAEIYVSYIIERSTDFENWETVVENVVYYDHDGPVSIIDVMPDSASTVFYRIGVN